MRTTPTALLRALEGGGRRSALRGLVIVTPL
jgi:hypothetical protein